jgi:hypothetical protein
VRALQAERANNFSAALTLMQRMSDLQQAKPFVRAFRAMLLLRTGDVPAAHKLFAGVRAELRGEALPEREYVRRYAQYFLAMLNMEPAQAEYEAREALKLDCRPALKRWLWLPEEPPRHPLDAEFEEWMNTNYPEAPEKKP